MPEETGGSAGESAAKSEVSEGADRPDAAALEDSKDTGEKSVSVMRGIFGKVFAAERDGEIQEKDREAGLEEGDGIIYFSRIVRVDPVRKEMNIEFEQKELRFPADTVLYKTILRQETEMRSPSTAMEDGEKKGFQVDESYELVLKNQSLILGDAFVTDKEGKRIKGVTVNIKDDSGLKIGAAMREPEEGGEDLYMEPGVYGIELFAVNPKTGEGTTAFREIIIEGAQRIKFDVPALILGTKNLTYDLKTDMRAFDEQGKDAEFYVIEENQLLSAKETYADEESGEVLARLREGIYQVTMGAKHPVTGEEFTTAREVQVLDGYYIYAPDLLVAAGSSNYNLLEGVEVRSTDEEGKTIDLEVVVKDSSELGTGIAADTSDEGGSPEKEADKPKSRRRRSLDEFPTEIELSAEVPMNSLEETAGDGGTSLTEDGAATPSADAPPARDTQTDNPPLAEGDYRVLLASADPSTGKEIVKVRKVRAVGGGETRMQCTGCGANVNRKYITDVIGTMDGIQTDLHAHKDHSGERIVNLGTNLDNVTLGYLYEWRRGSNNIAFGKDRIFNDTVMHFAQVHGFERTGFVNWRGNSLKLISPAFSNGAEVTFNNPTDAGILSHLTLVEPMGQWGTVNVEGMEEM